MERSTLKDHYRHVERNGHTLTMVDDQILDTLCEHNPDAWEDFFRITTEKKTWYFAVSPLTRNKIYALAGITHETHVFDWAVPQSWLDLPRNKERWYRGEKAIWIYDEGHHGRPLWDGQVWHLMVAYVTKTLSEE